MTAFFPSLLASILKTQTYAQHYHFSYHWAQTGISDFYQRIFG